MMPCYGKNTRAWPHKCIQDCLLSKVHFYRALFDAFYSALFVTDVSFFYYVVDKTASVQYLMSEIFHEEQCTTLKKWRPYLVKGPIICFQMNQGFVEVPETATG